MHISSNYNVSFGHIYSQAVDKVIKNSADITKKQESQLNKTVDRAAGFQKSVITASTSQGLVLLSSTAAGNRQIEKTYPMGYDAKTNIEQLQSAVQDAEKLEKTGRPVIQPLKGNVSASLLMGSTEEEGRNSRYQNIYSKTINGYNAKF